MRLQTLIVILFCLVAVADNCFSQNSFPGPGPGQCAQSPGKAYNAPPVPRTVTVTVPVKPDVKLIHPRLCAPNGFCPPSVPQAQNVRPAPVRVDVTVRPEPADQGKLAPVIFRDPGILKPVVNSAIALTGAVIAAPFRLLDMLAAKESCNTPRNQCRPALIPGCRPPSCPSQPFAPMATSPCLSPLPPVALGCAPTGPSVAPLPPCRPPVGCSPSIPPKMVERDVPPPCEPQSLLGGIVNLPSRLATYGRLFGDVGECR